MKGKSWSNRRISVAILFLFLFSIFGCDSSHKTELAKESAYREDMTRTLEDKIKIQSDQIVEKYGAISFPPNEIETNLFTYTFQTFFSEHEEAIVFRAYLEDIEIVDNDIMAEFLCPIGNQFYIDKSSIRFNLKTNKEKMRNFLKGKKQNSDLRSWRYFEEPEYFVVAKINKIKKLRWHEISGSTNGDEVRLSVEAPPNFVSIGELIEAVPVFNEQKVAGKSSSARPNESARSGLRPE